MDKLGRLYRAYRTVHWFALGNAFVAGELYPNPIADRMNNWFLRVEERARYGRNRRNRKPIIWMLRD